MKKSGAAVVVLFFLFFVSVSARKLLYRLSVRLRQRMHIEVLCGLYGRMSQQVTHYGRVDALFVQRRSEGVPESVWVDMLESVLVLESLKIVIDRIGTHRQAFMPGLFLEEQIPCFVPPVAVCRLALQSFPLHDLENVLRILRECHVGVLPLAALLRELFFEQLGCPEVLPLGLVGVTFESRSERREVFSVLVLAAIDPGLVGNYFAIFVFSWSKTYGSSSPSLLFGPFSDEIFLGINILSSSSCS